MKPLTEKDVATLRRMRSPRIDFAEDLTGEDVAALFSELSRHDLGPQWDRVPVSPNEFLAPGTCLCCDADLRAVLFRDPVPPGARE